MKQRKKHLFNQLSAKISSIATVIIIVLMIISGGILYNSIKQTSEHSIAMSSIETAQNIASHLDGNKYNEFLQNQTESDLYWELRHQLNDFRIKSGVLYVYTLGVTENKDVLILIDGMPEDEVELAAHIGEPIDVTTYDHIEPVLNGEGSFSEIVEDPSYGDYLSAFAPITDNDGNTIGILGVDMSADQVGLITTEVTKSILPIFIVAISVLMVIAIIILVRYIIKSLRPLQYIEKAANNIANGNVQKASHIINRLPKSRPDEIGQLSQSIQNMVEQLKAIIQSISVTSENVTASSEELSANAEQAVDINKHIEQAIREVAAGSNSQLLSTEQSAESIVSITNNIQEISNNTAIASDTSIHALEETERGKQTIEDILAQMNTISHSTSNIAQIIEQLDKNSHQIVNIVDMITDIAEQTNLLALNAAIEAARAGEHGQGFAVVSEEIRKLADESKTSADQITSLIHSISEDTKEAVQTMNKGIEETKIGAQMAVTVDKAFQSILDNVTTMTNQTQEVSASSQQILANSEEVTALIDELANIAQQTANNSEQVALNTKTQLNTMQDVSQSSEDLSKITVELQNIVGRFKI